MPRSVVQSLSTVVSRRRSFPRCVRGAMRSLETRSQRWLSVRSVLSRPVAAFCPPKSPRTLFVFRSVDRFSTIFLRSSSPPSFVTYCFSPIVVQTRNVLGLCHSACALPTAATTGQKSSVRKLIIINSCPSSEYLWHIRLVRDMMSIAGVRRSTQISSIYAIML